MKGLILAGGNATRLLPLTKVLSKQLLPIYNKPMIFYPLSTLMMAGIRDIAIISTHAHINLFEDLFGDGRQLGIEIQYIVQNKPAGLADAFIVGEEFIGNQNCSLILGDNIFYGNSLHLSLKKASTHKDGALIFAYHVDSPEAYGVLEFNKENKVISIEEKPRNPKSNFAVTGLYFYDNQVVDIAKCLSPSARGELEITDLNNEYLKQGCLNVSILGSGTTWLDTGTHDSLIEASTFVRTIEKRQGALIGSPEAVAFLNKWIDVDGLTKLIDKYPTEQSYKSLLLKVLDE